MSGEVEIWCERGRFRLPVRLRLSCPKVSLATWLKACWTINIMQSDVIPHLPVNHVFVDLENVKAIDATVLGGKYLKIHLFVGVQTKKLDVDVVEKLLEHAQVVQMIRSPKQGKNALDFVLAYHLG